MILVEGACMRMSKRSEYGLKAAVRLATHHAQRSAPMAAGGDDDIIAASSASGGYLQSREIADAERLPPKFLESVLLSLRSAQLLVSKVGAGGGYRLSRSPDQIRVHEVIDALERDDQIQDEPIPEDASGHRALSVLHQRLDDAVAEALGSLTLGDLIQLSRRENVRA